MKGSDREDSGPVERHEKRIRQRARRRVTSDDGPVRLNANVATDISLHAVVNRGSGRSPEPDPDAG